MLYVVLVYFAVCGLALVFLPTNMTDERSKKGTIFDKDIEEQVKEHQKDIPPLKIGD